MLLEISWCGTEREGFRAKPVGGYGVVEQEKLRKEVEKSMLNNAEEPPPSDHEKVEADGATVWVEPPALFHIVGTVMDFEESALETGFTFTNPNEKGRCGCGESFNV